MFVHNYEKMSVVCVCVHACVHCILLISHGPAATVLHPLFLSFCCSKCSWSLYSILYTLSVVCYSSLYEAYVAEGCESNIQAEVKCFLLHCFMCWMVWFHSSQHRLTIPGSRHGNSRNHHYHHHHLILAQ